MYERVEMEALGVQGVEPGRASAGTGYVPGRWVQGYTRAVSGGGKPGILLSNSSRPGGLER